MMPLTFANAGEENIIKKVGGNPETKKFLENLGFVAGSTVTVSCGFKRNGKQNYDIILMEEKK